MTNELSLSARIGEVLRMRRKEKKLSRNELGRLAKVSPAMLYRYEVGEHDPALCIMFRIVKALDLSLDELVRLQYPDFKICSACGSLEERGLYGNNDPTQRRDRADTLLPSGHRGEGPTIQGH